MTRTRLAAAAVLSLSLLAPVAAASSASAAPQTCNQAVVKDHKINKGKRNGHNKPSFVHAGKVRAVGADSVTFTVRGGQNKALRGCDLVVLVTPDTKIKRNGEAVTLAQLAAGDHVNVKGTSEKVGATVTYTAKRIAASAAQGNGKAKH